MKNIFKFVLLAAIFLPAASTAAVVDPCSKYEFFWKARPAFMPESTVSIEADGGSAHAIVTFSDGRYSPRRSDQLILTHEASKNFCEALLRLVPMPQKQDMRGVLDGIYIEGSFSAAGGTPDKFSFQSPTIRETPRDFGIVDAVFTAFENATVSCELNDYLERLTQYFHFGLPVKVITTEPLTLRWYGNFSISDYMDIQTLLAKLSKSQSIRIDVTNFQGMGTMYYPDFGDLVRKVPDISWTASENSARMLAEIGVRPEKIRITEDPNCKGERVRFARS